MSDLLAALVCTLVAQAGEPSGRPPVAGGPLERFEPRIYEFRFNVHISTAMQISGWDRQSYNFEDAPIVMPLTYQSTFSSIAPESVSSKLHLFNKVPNISQSTRIEGGKPFNTHHLIIPIEKYNGQSVRFEVSYMIQTWSSRLTDEQAAANVAWPQEWPAEVLDGLKPQMYIESDDPIFKQTVERVSQGKLRMVPPYFAAKELIRYCVDELRLTGSGTNRGLNQVLQGMEVHGAKHIATEGIGSPHDLVCACVAMLRAAGIPARPVVGVYEKERNRKDFVSWAEFYLPDVGWIPFDPVEMKSKAVRHRELHEPWPEFGTMKELNERVPMAFGFIPSATVQVPQNPAVWGWDPRPGGDPSSEQIINITMISRGPGKEDPTVRE